MSKGYIGRNDRKYNHNKYGARVSTEGHEVLPSGAIVNRVLEQKQRKQKAPKKSRK